MPYVSDAQRKKFHVLEKEGKIKHSVVKEYDSASKGMDLPEHVPTRKKPPRKSK